MLPPKRLPNGDYFIDLECLDEDVGMSSNLRVSVVGFATALRRRNPAVESLEVM